MSVNWLTYDLLLLQRWRVVREAKTMTLLINTFTEKVFPTYLKNEFRIQHICRRNKNNLLRKLYIFQFFTCFKPHHKIMIHGTTLCIKDIEGTSNLFYIPFRTDHNVQKIELRPTKAASQRAQMSDVKLNFFTYISYWRLTKKQSVGIGISYSGFPFYEHCNRQLIHIFYIKTLKVTSSTKR